MYSLHTHTDAHTHDRRHRARPHSNTHAHWGLNTAYVDDGGGSLNTNIIFSTYNFILLLTVQCPCMQQQQKIYRNMIIRYFEMNTIFSIHFLWCFCFVFSVFNYRFMTGYYANNINMTNNVTEWFAFAVEEIKRLRCFQRRLHTYLWSGFYRSSACKSHLPKNCCGVIDVENDSTDRLHHRIHNHMAHLLFPLSESIHSTIFTFLQK